MGEHIVITGIVLGATPVGEYDKRITLLTKERGKISAFARGARRSNNRMMAASNPFVFGEFELYEGKNTYTLGKAEVKNYFRELAEDYERVCLGYYFLEVAQYYAQENADEVERLRLLYQSLRALESEKYSKGLLKVVYEIKTMAINGEYPNVFECIKCGTKQNLTCFSVKHQGCLCKECEKNEGGILLDDTLLYVLQFIITSSIEKLYTFALSQAKEEELIKLVLNYRKNYEAHHFKTEDFIQ